MPTILISFYKTSNPEAAARQIQEDINCLNSWLKVNKLTLNTAKCNYIVIKNPSKSVPQLEIHLQDRVLARTERVNYLGILIDQHLTFKYHVDHICNKISPAVGILSKVRWVLPRNICILLYNALIHCRLSYCIESWGSASDNVLYPLEILQKRAVRFICFKPFTDHTLPLFKKLGILSVRNMFYFKVCQLVFKELHGMNNVDSFGFRFAQHSIGTRSVSNQLLCLPYQGNNLTKALFQTMSNVGPRLFNKVPHVIKTTPSLSLFKQKLRSWLVDNYPPVYKIIYPHKN